MDSSLETLTRKLVRLAIEKRLRRELDLAAPELPEEVKEDLYHKLFRPVMIRSMLTLKEVVERESRSGA